MVEAEREENPRGDRTMKVAFVTAAVLAIPVTKLCTAASAPVACGLTSKTGDLCFCKVRELQPTQLAVGMIEVREKEAELSSKSSRKLEAYQQKHPEPVVKGPGNALFITDHHHLARALADRGIETTYCQIEADYSSLDPGPFWAKMEEQNWVYLYDENGKGPRDPAGLPRSVEGLKDDPYRSLAGAVRRKGGFAKVPTPFAEFKWADFFRPRISVSDIEENFKKAVKEASAIATKRSACSLPGYQGAAPCR
jgi:hypothetical protein